MEESIMPNKENKDQWHTMVSRFASPCYGCGKTIRSAMPIMYSKRYKVAMHMGCYRKYIEEEHEDV